MSRPFSAISYVVIGGLLTSCGCSSGPPQDLLGPPATWAMSIALKPRSQCPTIRSSSRTEA
jgi:hypothetical protein